MALTVLEGGGAGDSRIPAPDHPEPLDIFIKRLHFNAGVLARRAAGEELPRPRLTVLDGGAGTQADA